MEGKGAKTLDGCVLFIYLKEDPLKAKKPPLWEAFPAIDFNQSN